MMVKFKPQKWNRLERRFKTSLKKMVGFQTTDNILNTLDDHLDGKMVDPTWGSLMQQLWGDFWGP
jgi:hypothetical protein